MALIRYYRDQYVNDRYESFVPAIESPRIIKNVGSSQFTDGVRIKKRYHSILNPSGSEYYVDRGTARKIKVLFNNMIFDAEYRYEGQKNQKVELQSIRFKQDLKNEFRKVFLNAKGEFSIEFGVDLNHFIFTPINTDNKNFDDQNEFEEGRATYRNHKIRERNPRVVEKAKTLFRKEHHGRIYCEVCGFDFHLVYGALGEDYIEGHHVIPVAELKEGDVTRVEDIVMLCANCHRIMHRNRGLTLDKLSASVRSVEEIVEAKKRKIKEHALDNISEK
jgi:5-methylcytosine-specific restriction endonuclease McrA